MERKLASIQKITDIREIPGADSIDVATILGWQCVIRKGEFKVGDTIVFIEVDSILPERAEFEFLRNRKFRVKTIEMRGQISQGLVQPLSILPSQGLYAKWVIGQDVTDLLNIQKYDPQDEVEKKLSETKKVSPVTKFLRRFKWYRKLFMMKGEGGFPSWIQKTDEIRIQNFPNICQEHKNTLLEVTEKLDGQSATYFLKRGRFGRLEFGVCSRNNLLSSPDNSSWWKIAKKFKIKEVLTRLIGRNDFIVLQGEIIGEGIQKNKYKISGIDFYAFNLKASNMSYDNFWMHKALAPYGIKTVPILEAAWILPKTIELAEAFATGHSWVNGKVQREGVVCRNQMKKLSFKIINKKFLLEHKE